MGYIYKITNQVNSKIYIGQTTRTIKERWQEHRKNICKYKEKYPLYKALYKYGIDNFIIEEIEECDNKELDDREIYWIHFFQSFGDGGYNCTKGGQGATMLTTYDEDIDEMIQRYQRGERLDKICKDFHHDYICIRREFLKKGIEIDTHAGPKKISKIVFAINPETKEVVKKYPSISAAGRDICASGASARAISNHISKYKDTNTISHGFL